MKDKTGVEIKVGDLVKKTGIVQYALGPREKVSKKTWIAMEHEGVLGLMGQYWERFDLDEGVEYLVVGNINEGLKEKHHSITDVEEAPTARKYKLLKEDKKRGWKVGDVVQIHGKLMKNGEEVRKTDALEWVADDVPHQHVLVVIDPLKLSLNMNKPNK